MLNSIKTKFIEILKDESGQGTTEYILILVAIVGIAALFRKEITLQVDKIIQKLGSNITDAIG
ncbi:MAG: hypothetical protein HAW60_01020 [Bdellovibrionales bacterium]|nr:hypothetical protein [Bdellovibrionales bacterium]